MADVGRPTIMTPVIIAKLEEVFALGGSDEEACFYAGIGKSTLYSYQQDHPEFVERKDALKETPILKARRTAVTKLEESYQNAMDFLKRKRKKEFGDSTDITSNHEKIDAVAYIIPTQHSGNIDDNTNS